jgi:hypothetical protein
VAVAASGFIGHILANRAYPQPMEQVPSDLLLVPFGLVAGFFVAFIARLAKSQWTGAEMTGVVFLASVAYAAMNGNYAQGRAIPPGLVLEFEPDPATAERCFAACPPDTEWTIKGFAVVRAIRVEATVSSIEITSAEILVPGKPVSRSDAAFKFRGPKIRLTGADIVGERHLKPNDIVKYPITYSYQNAGAESARQVLVLVQTETSEGYPPSAYRAWTVR